MEGRDGQAICSDWAAWTVLCLMRILVGLSVHTSKRCYTIVVHERNRGCQLQKSVLPIDNMHEGKGVLLLN